ncbi:Lysophospholipase L1 [Streptoalloteichus tenebrarius]|uniref:Lysophospholipase L1 n=1 Tax=Streptoalloteichus tenebrarius (strain ATCC 17920 / DSM 40477 / JCM 4838 / CBS 697.72 / NBRC 16177 / NCIMB 11028 / NRRL B-12390 / A12253. 1 / ISP 5477) TaxID=1933 RepID=A0ABT1HQ95_STRSD|nr:GDSL-type esterase/lipase family protein [Streptoalloteichus tenebrarius]MCP2257682.1 Lysophospholipase L1 [Streptoalloteichus tenebrarius]BFE98642.1 SGNH/GDSL hydrolase family protein [Streptoalloteichus tenebrarius]
MTTRWVAGFRSAVISPDESVRFNEPRGFHDQTVRQVLHMAGGGERVRVRLSNRYGRSPLTVGVARLAERGIADQIVTETDVVLRFDGSRRVTVPPGGEVVSDPVELAVRAGDDLVLSLHLPEETGLATFSHMPVETAHVADGDQTGAANLVGAEEVEGRFFVTGVDVLAPEGAGVAVAFGDSWFEGVGSTVGANRRSVDWLNRRLRRGWVVNQGIAGNRLLTDGVGEHALARFERDVLSVPGVTQVLAHFGINDLGLPGMLGLPPATADDLVAGFTELAHRAHEAGLVIHAATIGPFAGAIYPGHNTPEGLAARREVNEWIRGGSVFDAVFDVARAVEDPARPDYLRPEFDSGDGMHLNDAGARAMAECVDLDVLRL